jgi:hypothetical protein
MQADTGAPGALTLGAMNPDAPSPTLEILLSDDQDARERLGRLLPLVYYQLRAAAKNYLREERAGHTLDATALVH